MSTELINLILFLIVWIAAEWFVFRAFQSIFKKKSRRTIKLANWGYWLLFSLLLVYFLISFYKIEDGYYQNANYAVFFLFTNIVCKIFITLLLLLISFFRKVKYIANNKKRKTVIPESDFNNQRRDFLKMAALSAGAIPLAASVYSFSQGAFRFIVRKQKIYLKNFPVSMNGFRVCQISDIHASFITNNRKFNEGISLLLEQKPHMIFFTGDLVSNESSEVNDVFEILSRIKAPLGVFSVLGNHDYAEYATWMTDEERKTDIEKMISIQRSMGWKLLMNENAMIDEDIAIVGTENWGDISRFPKKADMTKALAGTESAAIKFLLTHDPSFWNLKILNHYKEIQMTFSGHTHAFQFGVDMFGKKWSPAQYLYPTWDGLYKKNEQYLYVNRGMGNAGFSGRLGMWPEIAVFDFFRL